MSATKDNSDWKDGFLFVGNELVLDFLNTRPIQNGEPRELLTDFRALLRWFHAADVIQPTELSCLQSEWDDTAQARRTVESMRDLREKLRNEILSWQRGAALHKSTIGDLNRLMLQHPMRTRLSAHERVYSTEPWFELQKPEDLFGPLAHSAVKLFTEVRRERVRKCDQCVLQFHDTSKKGTRRWCSMKLCGNRAKVATYAARRRQG